MQSFSIWNDPPVLPDSSSDPKVAAEASAQA